VIRFLHTADVQLVASTSGDSPELKARREARFTALKRLVALACEEQVDFIAICGDFFEDNLVSDEAVYRGLRILQEADTLPVFILPGNHDPFSSGSVYRRSAFDPSSLGNVRVLSTTAPVAVTEQCTLYPCPVMEKTSLQDPTADIPARERQDELRIGLAHGSLKIEGKYQDDDHPISLEAWKAHDLDYLALGHWHSRVLFDEGRVAYSGTPEQTSFSERDAGYVLLVTISGPGAQPEIESHRVGTLNWEEWDRTVQEPLSDALECLKAEVEALEGREKTLLRLVLEGMARADSLSLLRDFEKWLGEAGLLRAEIISKVASVEQLEGVLQALVESDEVIAGVVADLRRLATLDTGGGEPNGEISPWSVEELIDAWNRCKSGIEDLYDDFRLAQILEAVNYTNGANGALQLLAYLAKGVQA